MSRRAQIVHTQFPARGRATPRVEEDEEPFTWNAMLASPQPTEIVVGVEVELATEEPRHSSLGVDVDFTEDTPGRRIRVPRDGVYSVSARVVVESEVGGNPLHAGNTLRVAAMTTGPLGSADTHLAHFGFGAPRVSGHVSHAGWPLLQGDTVWLVGFNEPFDPGYGFTAYVVVESFSVTYEAALGTIFLPGGG